MPASPRRAKPAACPRFAHLLGAEKPPTALQVKLARQTLEHHAKATQVATKPAKRVTTISRPIESSSTKDSSRPRFAHLVSVSPAPEELAPVKQVTPAPRKSEEDATFELTLDAMKKTGRF